MIYHRRDTPPTALENTSTFNQDEEEEERKKRTRDGHLILCHDRERIEIQSSRKNIRLTHTALHNKREENNKKKKKSIV